MNVSASSRTLILGIGNPLRSDDGLGWAVAEQLIQENEPGCDIRMVHQLTPEVAQWLASANLVILIDASREGEPGDLHVRPLSPFARPGAIGTHHTKPEELLALTTTLYNFCPPAVLVSMTGASFSLGEQLSPIVAEKIHLVKAAVREEQARAFSPVLAFRAQQDTDQIQ